MPDPVVPSTADSTPHNVSAENPKTTLSSARTSHDPAANSTVLPPRLFPDFIQYAHAPKISAVTVTEQSGAGVGGDLIVDYEDGRRSVHLGRDLRVHDPMAQNELSREPLIWLLHTPRDLNVVTAEVLPGPVDELREGENGESPPGADGAGARGEVVRVSWSHSLMSSTTSVYHADWLYAHADVEKAQQMVTADLRALRKPWNAKMFWTDIPRIDGAAVLAGDQGEWFRFLEGLLVWGVSVVR